jgi:hypothetical protein
MEQNHLFCLILYIAERVYMRTKAAVDITNHDILNNFIINSSTTVVHDAIHDEQLPD